MRIAVVVKQVPAFTEMALDADGRLIRTGLPLELNPYCRRAVSQAVDLARPAATPAGNPYLRPEEGSSILRQIMIQAENYPELKAGSQFTKLQYSFQECEEQIAAGRRFLSASITDYNTSTVVFPWNIAARVFGFKPYQWQYASEGQRQNVDAQDLFRKS